MPDGRSSSARRASCLHLVVGAGQQALDDCLAQAKEGDSVLFLDAGVLQLLHKLPRQSGSSAVAAYYSAADLRAHGLLEVARREGADVVDDAGCCELLALHPHSLTWK